MVDPEVELNEEEILEELQKTISEEFGFPDDKSIVRSVIITSDFGTGFIKANMLPAIAIMTEDLDPTYGPIANVETLKLGIKIRILTQSTDPNKYIIESKKNTIYKLSRTIRGMIKRNKTLNKKAFGLGSLIKVKKIRVVPIKNAGFFAGCDISYSYEILEAWTGSRNDQKSSKIPEGIKF